MKDVYGHWIQNKLSTLGPTYHDHGCAPAHTRIKLPFTISEAKIKIKLPFTISEAKIDVSEYFMDLSVSEFTPFGAVCREPLNSNFPAVRIIFYRYFYNIPCWKNETVFNNRIPVNTIHLAMFDQCWPIVYDVGPTLVKHWPDACWDHTQCY